MLLPPPAAPVATPTARPTEKLIRPRESITDTIIGYLTSPLALGNRRCTARAAGVPGLVAPRWQIEKNPQFRRNERATLQHGDG
ncbi:MAG: hypothetical protein IPP88_22780 [Betaproteobacteria bacterium]|nr:hypothetical protein [Betaproteobacteria bacterium]